MSIEPLNSALGQQEVPLLTDQSPQGLYMKNAVLYAYCVFHKEPAVALLVFIFVITRPFLVFGVFVGLFMGVRRYDFFWGGSFWRNRAILRPF